MKSINPGDTTSVSSSNAGFSMFYEPMRAFHMLSPRRYGWVPLLLVMASSLTLMLWYFSTVDFAWLQEQLVASVPANDRDVAKQFMTKNVLLGGAVLGALIGTPAIMAVTGLYLVLISKTLNKPFTFNDGFSASAWSSIPAVLALPLGAIQILMSSHGQLTFSELNPLSLNQLFFHYELTHPMATLLDSVSLPMFWSIVLLVIAYEAWAKVARSTAMKVVLIPYAIIYGLWLVFAMSKAA